MRSLLLLVLAACGVSSTGTRRDAAVDAPARQDASALIDAPVDAYVRRACDAPPTFADGLTPTRVLHVSPGAINGDGSAAKPFGSIAAAAAVATPGTFIQLAPGLHAPNQFVPALRGTADAPIWIGGVFGTRPIIEGGSEALHLTQPAYVVIQYLELRYQTANGINIDDGVSFAGDAHHVAVIDVALNNIASTSTSTCLKASGVNDLAIHDSQFSKCSNGIDQLGVHRAVIARNRFTEIWLSAVQARGGSTDIDVRQNRIHDAGVAGISMGGSTPLALFRPQVSTTAPNAEARRIRAFDNVVTGTTYLPFSFLTCSDCLVAHNLIHGNPTYLLRIAAGTTTQAEYEFEPTRDGRVINNSFVWSTALSKHVDMALGPSVEPTTFTFSNNLWQFVSTSPGSSVPVLPVSETGSVIGAGTGYGGDAVGEFCGGPEAGAAAPLPEIDGTIEGYCRADAYAPTIGPQTLMVPGCPI